jgi:hypothetical protein
MIGVGTIKHEFDEDMLAELHGVPQALIRRIRIDIASNYTINNRSSGGWPVNQARALRINSVSGLSRMTPKTSYLGVFKSNG